VADFVPKAVGRNQRQSTLMTGTVHCPYALLNTKPWKLTGRWTLTSMNITNQQMHMFSHTLLCLINMFRPLPWPSSGCPIARIQSTHNIQTIASIYTSGKNRSKGGGVIFNNGCGCYGEDKNLSHARNQAQIPRSSSQQPRNYSAYVISAYNSQIIQPRLTNIKLVTIRTECRS